MSDLELENIYTEHLEEDIVLQLSKKNNISLEKAMQIYYQSKLANWIHSGEFGVQYLDSAVLVELLEKEGAEAVVPDIVDFFNYSVYGSQYKHKFLGAKKTASNISKVTIKIIQKLRKPAIAALEKSKRFHPPMSIEKIAEMTKPFLSLGNQYGEGWFLVGEMVELIPHGTPNIVCIQPFACLPNHVVGKGVIKKLKELYPEANITAVDYDPGASEVNQLNRIKLMLSAAKNNL